MTKTPPDGFRAPGAADRQEAATLVRCARAGVLSLIPEPGGPPDVSRVGLATDIDGAPIFPVSSLSGRGPALESDRGAALFIGEIGKGDPLAHGRVSLTGRCMRCDGEDWDRARDRYLARHPKASLYIDFEDFSLWRFEVAAAVYVGGFGRAYHMEAGDVVLDAAGAGALARAWGAREAGAREHMNDDHSDAVALYARAFVGAGPGAWHLSGIDPTGLDVRKGDDHRRIWFDAPLSGPGDMHRGLVELVGVARARLDAEESAK